MKKGVTKGFVVTSSSAVVVSVYIYIYIYFIYIYYTTTTTIKEVTGFLKKKKKKKKLFLHNNLITIVSFYRKIKLPTKSDVHVCMSDGKLPPLWSVYDKQDVECLPTATKKKRCVLDASKLLYVVIKEKAEKSLTANSNSALFFLYIHR